MIAFIALIYASFYFVVFGKGLVKKSPRNISIFVAAGVVVPHGIDRPPVLFGHHPLDALDRRTQRETKH